MNAQLFKLDDTYSEKSDQFSIPSPLPMKMQNGQAFGMKSAFDNYIIQSPSGINFKDSLDRECSLT